MVFNADCRDPLARYSGDLPFGKQEKTRIFLNTSGDPLLQAARAFR